MEPDYKWKMRLNFHKEFELKIKKIKSGYLNKETVENIYKKLAKDIESKGLLCKDSLN